MNLTISRGTRDDYDALARYHYRAPRPATPVLTLAAREGDTLIGVLVVTMPTLNAPWRRTAWPELFPTSPSQREGAGGWVQEAQGQRRASLHASSTTRSQSLSRHRGDAVIINRHIRTIARVIVEPRYRALGVARALVQHYLANPLTTHTEAVAAMGRCCPFFTRAGMREITPPPSRRDRRLSLTLRTLNLEPWELVDIDRARSALSASDTLRAAIWRWAADSKRAFRA